ncbi:hypothetical protein PYCCODRAFT_1440873 [Trametes coccinea BRFM310]|uniref:Uncharacterized protein n=1 Tax=Trametes coccinea (strain BRFM310) TaxID=1353009 RepID=A0A1Y2I875_TRAC3|nr:hypothetical protein PYCCODRAFT_1440873 [Trametes coccinea BRFM310]
MQTNPTAGLAGHSRSNLMPPAMSGAIPLTPSLSPLPAPVVRARPGHRRTTLCRISCRTFTEVVTVFGLTTWFAIIIVLASGLFALVGLHFFRLLGQSPNSKIFSGAGWVAMLIGSMILGAALGFFHQVIYLGLNDGKPYTFSDGSFCTILFVPVAYVVGGFAPSLGVAVRPSALVAVGLTSAEALKIGGAGMGVFTAVAGIFLLAGSYGVVCIT